MAEYLWSSRNMGFIKQKLAPVAEKLTLPEWADADLLGLYRQVFMDSLPEDEDAFDWVEGELREMIEDPIQDFFSLRLLFNTESSLFHAEWNEFKRTYLSGKYLQKLLTSLLKYGVLEDVPPMSQITALFEELADFFYAANDRMYVERFYREEDIRYEDHEDLYVPKFDEYITSDEVKTIAEKWLVVALRLGKDVLANAHKEALNIAEKAIESKMDERNL
jgi:hypothetical protein